MASEIGLCCELWKYRSKKSLPQIAHLRCGKSRCITIGILTKVFRHTIAQNNCTFGSKINVHGAEASLVFSATTPNNCASENKRP
jgi:hypothetical protein